MARSMSARAKPMLSMLAIAASRSLPMVKAEGSLKRSDCWAGAGEGVAGTFCEAEDEGAGAEGAAGAAGVWGAALAGVEGAALLDEAAGCLGWRAVSVGREGTQGAARTLETMQTMKPFSSMLYDSTVLASWRILPVARGQQVRRPVAPCARWSGSPE
jgi:hypothetical protein